MDIVYEMIEYHALADSLPEDIWGTAYVNGDCERHETYENLEKALSDLKTYYNDSCEWSDEDKSFYVRAFCVEETLYKNDEYYDTTARWFLNKDNQVACIRKEGHYVLD